MLSSGLLVAARHPPPDMLPALRLRTRGPGAAQTPLTSCPPGPAAAPPGAHPLPGESRTLPGGQAGETDSYGASGDTTGPSPGPQFPHLPVLAVIRTRHPQEPSEKAWGGRPGSLVHRRAGKPWDSPRWARSEMTSLFSQSFRPVDTARGRRRAHPWGPGDIHPRPHGRLSLTGSVPAPPQAHVPGPGPAGSSRACAEPGTRGGGSTSSRAPQGCVSPTCLSTTTGDPPAHMPGRRPWSLPARLLPLTSPQGPPIPCRDVGPTAPSLGTSGSKSWRA